MVTAQNRVSQTTRRRNGKTQEVEFHFLIYVHPMNVSQEHVVKYRNLFLDAIEWYSKTLVEELAEKRKNLLPYVQNQNYNLLVDLRKRVDLSNDIPRGKINNLLRNVVEKYRSHLLELKKEAWIRDDVVDSQLTQLDEITANEVVTKSSRALT